MDSNEAGRPGDAQARYVWDREKLSWVEAAAAPHTAEATVDADVERPLAAIPEETGPALVSAEGEELQLRGAWMRVIGMAIDMVVLLLITSMMQVVFGSGSIISAFLMPLLGFAFFVGLWALRGQTPGKMAIGAKVVRLDGSPAGLPRLLARYIVFLAYFYAMAASASYWVGFPLIVALIIIAIVALSRSKRGLHDLVGGTIVINSRPQLMEDYEDEVWEAAESESDALLLEED